MDSGPTIAFTPSSGVVVLRSPTTKRIDSDGVNVLREARRLIELRDDRGQVNYRAFRERRCAIRALCEASVMLNLKPAGDVAGDWLDEVARRHGYITTECMNDHSSHEQILSAFGEVMVAARRSSRSRNG